MEPSANKWSQTTFDIFKKKNKNKILFKKWLKKNILDFFFICILNKITFFIFILNKIKFFIYILNKIKFFICILNKIKFFIKF